MLSKRAKKLEKDGLWRWVGLFLERVIDPFPEVFVGKEIPAQEGDEVGESPVPFTTMLEQLEQEHADECCPNLDFYGVGAGAYEGFDFEVLFDGFKEELDLPALFIDFGNGGGGKVKAVG